MVTLQLQTDSQICPLSSGNHSILTQFESRVKRQKDGQILKCVVAENTLKDCFVRRIFWPPLACSKQHAQSVSVGQTARWERKRRMGWNTLQQLFYWLCRSTQQLNASLKAIQKNVIEAREDEFLACICIVQTALSLPHDNKQHLQLYWSPS